MVYYGRTDLASEAHSQLLQKPETVGPLRGVRAESGELHALPYCAVEVLDEDGAALLKKPVGRYFTLTLPASLLRTDAVFSEAAEAVAELIGRCLPESISSGVLLAALGNPDITPDALGSLAASSLLVTRHLKERASAAFSDFASTALLRTGVLGTTGVESAVQLRALCDCLRPACVIAIDALAGCELEGLCRSVQICDTGISPGSGVGNDREALTRDSLGAPVIAVGVPTVMDCSALVQEDKLSDCFVTPRYIDSAVRTAARVIAYGINLALHPGITIADIDLLIG